jgi:hypothetical protein
MQHQIVFFLYCFRPTVGENADVFDPFGSSRMCVVDRCCFAVDLETGSYIIGIVEAAFGITSLFLGCALVGFRLLDGASMIGAG